MIINVHCEIGDEDNNQLNPEDIIEKVKALPKEEIVYLSSNFKSPQKQNYDELDCKDTIKIEKGDVYFIFDKDKLLYVGKSLHVKQRLGQHLIKCNKKTYSKIYEVQEYLKNNNLLKLTYCAIEISEKQFYGTVEGMIIKYIHDNKDDFPDNWNLRED